MRNILLVGILISSFLLIPSKAQLQYIPQNQYKFRYLTIEQGLSNNYIRAICQDSKGFIWLATQNGLNKFNGQTIVTYVNDAHDSTTISSNILFSVFLDSKNNLWIASEGGLDLYNADYDNFIRFNHKDIPKPLSHIQDITEDKNGNLWFGGITGLYKYNLTTSEITYFSNEAGNPHGIPPSLIYRLLVDRNNKVWISIMDEGLYVLDQSNLSHVQYRSIEDDNTTISSNRIERLYEDKDGNIWAGTFNNGLNLYIEESNSFRRFIPDPNNSYTTRVRAIFEDLKGNLFIGTRIGLYLYNKSTHEFVLYADDAHNFSKLSQNSITASFIDKSSTLWVGTFSGGANYTNLNRKEFIHYISGKDDNHYLWGSNIYAITEDAKGNLWIGGDNGLNYLDRSTYTFTYYLNDPVDPHSLGYNDIKDFEWDKKGNLWIATNKGGLNHYDVGTGRFTAYKHDPDNPASIIGDKVYCLLNDKFNNLWMIISPTSNFDSLYIDILPDGSDEFIHLTENSYFGLDQNDKGDVYIGGVKGFWVFNREDSTFNFIRNEEYIGNTYTIRVDSHGNLWIGSTKGLAGYNMKDKSFKRYSEETGYPFNEVLGVLEDENANLWISTNAGLVKLSNIVADASNPKIRVFDHDDGLQSKQFNYNAFYKSRSGEMAFGGINGFNTFFPEKILENKVPADIVLTGLKIFNTPVPIGEKVGGRIVLEKSISVTDELTLGPNQNIFTLEFASLQNANPGKYTFKFKLDGLDKDWQYRKAINNFVTYTNLSAGDYTFLVSAANSDGFWNEDPVKLKIHVIPHYWKTWWFRIIVGLGIIGLISGIYYSRVNLVRKQNVLLEETVKVRTQEVTDKNMMLQEANVLLREKQDEILAQKNELEQHRKHLTELVNERTAELKKALEKAKESDALKSNFLANMSHEIRTPMNAIMGFTNLLNEADLSDEERAKHIQIIQSNSKDLLKIIDEILDLSLIESNQLKLEQEVFELNVLIDHLYSFYFLNNNILNVKIKKNNSLQDQNLKLYSDSVRIKQIITNLMDNALKFTDGGYIELGAYEDNGNLCIYVKDTGKGIPADSVDKIFLHFTKIEDTDSVWTRGIGLGLAISNNIADALGGKILVDSTIGEGSTFTLNIPYKNIITEKELNAKEIKASVSERWDGKTIMIAEDVEENFLYVKKLLEKTKAKIIWAKNGEQAIQLASENQKINLILMDIKMPKMDGYDAAKQIKKQNPKQIIVAQTAYARTEEKQKFHDENFDEYISKPIDPADLITVLGKFLLA